MEESKANPKVSIIVPVYRAEKYVSKCIDSILNQSYPNWELILVDDGSPDNSGSICDQYAAKDNRIRVFHKENGGVSSARNLGLDIATGEWIGFVDADDWLETETLNDCCVYFGESDIVRFALGLYYGDGEVRESQFKTRCLSRDEYLEQVVARNTILGVCGGLYRKKLFTDNELYFDESLVNGEDWVALSLLVEYSHEISFVNRSLYIYNKTNEESSTSKGRFINYISALRALELIREMISADYVWKDKSVARAKCNIGYAYITGVMNKQIPSTIVQLKEFYEKIHLTVNDIRISNQSLKHGCLLLLLTSRLGLVILQSFACNCR